jgi:hypothetical protein
MWPAAADMLPAVSYDVGYFRGLLHFESAASKAVRQHAGQGEQNARASLHRDLDGLFWTSSERSHP